MAVDARKRQKKLERKNAKKRAERRKLARLGARGLPARLKEASAWPVLHCGATPAVWDEGIGHVLLSREGKNGNVAFVDFLVDRYCLGVKNLIMAVAPRADYREKLYDPIVERDRLIRMKPECVRKFVEGAVEYAEDLGIAPYSDYRVARAIFGDIPAEACTEEFEFGKDGMPLFIAGPFDTPARCNDIVHTLTASCGPDGFHYVMPAEAMWE